MMALGDVLAARANTARATARIECGSLGEVTLEALPVRELEQLSRGGDADRAIFYAACRDLQRTGAELMRQGRLYRPDQVTELVSADEAGIAAQTVRELSGWKDAPSGGEDGAQVLPEEGGQDSHESAKKRSASADAGDSADAPRPAVSHKGLFLFAKRNSPLWNPKEKALSADLEDGAVDERGGWAVDDTGAAAPTAGADAAVDEGNAGVRDETFSKGDRWRYSEGERSAPEGNEATPSAGAGARVDGGVPEGSSASADAGDSADAPRPAVRHKGLFLFAKRNSPLWNPKEKASFADLGVRAVDDRKSWVRDDTEAATPSAGADVVVDESGAKEGGQVSRESDLPEIRPEVVQENAEVRHDTVQQDLTENTEIRHSFVQDGGEESGDGQVSHEFLTESADEIAKPDGKQVLWSETAQTPQNVVKMDKTDSSLRNNEPSAEEKQNARKRKKPNRAHESKSEIEAARSGVLHENKSELTPGDVRLMHEITSEIAEAMHENKSEFRENVHESKSEKAEILHEDKSELAERVARELLEGLRRAAWVR